jgi:hypothetical protein
MQPVSVINSATAQAAPEMRIRMAAGRNRNLPNNALIELCDGSLSPVAQAGDLALIAQYAQPQNGDLVAYRHKGEIFVRWWDRLGSTALLTDAHGNAQVVSLSDILVLGVVREIRRPITPGRSPQVSN